MICIIFVCVVIHVLQSDHDCTYIDYTYIIKGISETDVKCTLHRSNSNTEVIVIIHWLHYCPWQFTDSVEYSQYLHRAQSILGSPGLWQT